MPDVVTWFVRDNKPRFRSPKQVCLSQLYQMCLLLCRWEVSGQEMHQDVCLPLVGGRREEVCQDTDLPQIEPDGKYDLVAFAFVSL